MTQGERYSRSETRGERLDRNFNEQLQEVRIAQAGVQILFAFLLTLPFQSRFTVLNDFQLRIYLVTLVSSASAVVFFTAPVAIHRVLFRRGVKDFIVRYTSILTSLGLLALGVAIVGGVVLVLDVLIQHTTAIWIGVVLTVIALILWVGVPEWHKRTTKPRKEDRAEADGQADAEAEDEQ